MAKIFISYRRSDSANVSGRIYDRLVSSYGRPAVFKDVDSIPAGVDFRNYIATIMAECVVELVIIGLHWLDATDEFGQRRLFNPNDFVRIEIETALARPDMLVIPVLVDGASMPDESAVPPSLKSLVRLNAYPGRPDPDFNADMRRVLNSIERLTGLQPRVPQHLDDEDPTPQRQDELRASYQPNRETGPYAGVGIYTRGELEWLLRERGWLGAVSEADPRRPDLRGIILSGANLTNGSLRYADLSGGDLYGTILHGADLFRARLNGADLRSARMDGATSLTGANLDSATRLGGVVWRDVPVAQIAWQEVQRLGDEDLVRMAKTRSERATALRDAAQAYRGLALTLRSQGLPGHASRYMYRQQVLERRALLLENQAAAWLASWMLDLVVGYGERPTRTLVAYLTILSTFAIGYYALSSASGSPHLTWYESLVLSISAFHGRGFFPSNLSLGDPYALVAAVEAVVGLFVEIILLATFGRRFLAE